MPDKQPSEPQQQQRQQQQQEHSLRVYDSTDEFKQILDEARARLMEDPRIKEMVEKRELSVLFHDPKQREDPNGLTTSAPIYTYKGFLYPVAHGGAFFAAPNTVFEVACTDSEISEKINLRPQLDVTYDAEENEIVFSLDLPGFEKKDILVEVENRCLTVSGGRPKDEAEARYGDEMKRLITERKFGFFYRSFQLPPNAIEDEVSAKMEAGVLFVRISTTDTWKGAERKRVFIC